MFVYDITNYNSFKNLYFWLKIVKNAGLEKVAKILMGNKSDLDEDRNIYFKDGKDYADKHNMKFIETSAKDWKKVDEAFTLMIEEILEKKNNPEIEKKIETNKEQMNINKINKKKCEYCEYCGS